MLACFGGGAEPGVTGFGMTFAMPPPPVGGAATTLYAPPCLPFVSTQPATLSHEYPEGHEQLALSACGNHVLGRDAEADAHLGGDAFDGRRAQFQLRKEMGPYFGQRQRLRAHALQRPPLTDRAFQLATAADQMFGQPVEHLGRRV